MFEGRAPSFADENVAGANGSPKFENIGMTTGGTPAGNPVTQTNGTVKPRSTLISDLKLAGQCVTAGVGGGNNTIPSGGECYLTAKMGNKANVAIKGTQVQVSRTADGVWSCKIKPASGSNNGAAAGWKDKFIPSGCSKENAGTTGNGWI